MLVIRAIENGANALAEGFLFGVAALLIIAETWRSSRNNTKRREDVDDRIEVLQGQVQGLTDRVDSLASDLNEKWEEEKARYVQDYNTHYLVYLYSIRNDELTRILERVVEIGLRGGWAEFEGTPLQLPRIELHRPHEQSDSTPKPEPEQPAPSSDVEK